MPSGKDCNSHHMDKSTSHGDSLVLKWESSIQHYHPKATRPSTEPIWLKLFQLFSVDLSTVLLFLDNTMYMTLFLKLLILLPINFTICEGKISTYMYAINYNHTQLNPRKPNQKLKINNVNHGITQLQLWNSLYDINVDCMTFSMHKDRLCQLFAACMPVVMPILTPSFFSESTFVFAHCWL